MYAGERDRFDINQGEIGDCLYVVDTGVYHAYLRQKGDKEPVQTYNSGFNFVLGDAVRGEFYLVYRYLGPLKSSGYVKLEAGLHVISNGSKDSDWFKCKRGKLLFEEIMDRNVDVNDEDSLIEDMLRLMSDTQKMPPDVQPPVTGYGEEIERRLSSIFVENTRATTIVLTRSDGTMVFVENYLTEKGEWTLQKTLVKEK